ncbi:MAG: hypothetical protein KDC61_18220 [Saprospiraceae bacterium]|nr:hypothetical protein [Saprospiraceae bacterium]MCB9355745.1 hypothetical protein [Lewinellaceae bacterium]
MKPTLKLDIKTFFLIGLTFGLLMTALSDFRDSGEGFGIGKIVLTGLLFGATAYLVFAIRKRIGGKPADVVRSRLIYSGMTPEEVLTRLKNDPKFGKMDIKATGTRIQIRSKISMQSWGETILIDQGAKSENGYEYSIVSKPNLSTTILDYGKNQQNVEAVERLMTAIA